MSRLRATPVIVRIGLLFSAFLAMYVYTAAPSVLSGDAAEFQMAASLLGVAHPTTYPLYVLLGKLATLVIPFGDLAWRVTLVSALSAALAVGLFFALLQKIFGTWFVALLGALALGLAPGLWNAATMAEVYALLAALIIVLAYLLVADATNLATRSSWFSRRLIVAALVGGLGFSHHGLFVITALPLLAGYLLALLIRYWPNIRYKRTDLIWLALIAFGFMLGMLPWLYPLLQYARYGPFVGDDYGLPRHYFWGAPESWGQVLDLLTGAQIRKGIFRMPTANSVLAVMQMVGRRLIFEFGPIGVLLGLFGSWALLQRSRALWIGSAWILFATLIYLVLLGSAVQDAPVFTLPMLLPWALWIAAGAEWGLRWLQQPHIEELRARLPLLNWLQLRTWLHTVLVLMVAVTLVWGYTRIHVSSKRRLWLFRDFATATLAQLPPNAVVITHWEQGMTLQYVRLVEGERPDVWVDVVEPSDDAWGTRAQRRYADRPVFFIGTTLDVVNLPVTLVRQDAYADLFALQ